MPDSTERGRDGRRVPIPWSATSPFVLDVQTPGHAAEWAALTASATRHAVELCRFFTLHSDYVGTKRIRPRRRPSWPRPTMR